MEQIFPSPVDDVDVQKLYRSDQRPSPVKRPWLMCNMISSIDGGIAIDGVSGGLGGSGDKQVFSAIRAVADVIVVGAGTVVAENYRPPEASEEIQQTRREHGQAPLPRIAIVSGSLNISPSHRVFDPESPPIILTHSHSPEAARSELATVADVRVVGDAAVDLPLALEGFKDDGTQCVLVEGGPTLNGAFVDQDLIDEWCLSSSPTIVGGNGPRIVVSRNNGPGQHFHLNRTLHDGGFLFHRYLRDRPNDAVSGA